MTKVESIAQLGMQRANFDYALPQQWVNQVHAETGVYPVPHFIWLYDKAAPLSGRPYPLDTRGLMILGALEIQAKTRLN
ncbi:MAG: hypothetical protein LLG06_04100 [Desulfobacteraceae bacterium]|nr:hypothetical protein [Desulfobacteraceae bacterium]